MAQISIPAVYGSSERDRQAIGCGGFVASVVDSVYTRVKPRWSAMQREQLKRASEPSDDVTLRRLLEGFPADWAQSFARHNKLLGISEDGVADFVPRVPLPEADASSSYQEAEMDAYDMIDSYRADADDKRARNRDKQAGVPKYFLHQIFSDTYVAEKLSIDEGFMIAISRSAVSNPKVACDMVVRHAKKNGLNVVVKVGNYSLGRKASRQKILDAAKGLPSVPYTCDVIGGKVVVSGVSGKGTVGSWTVSGDVWQMPEVDAIYRMAGSKGVSAVNALFSGDMVKVGVDLRPVGSDYGFDVQLHVGEFDESSVGNRIEDFGTAIKGFSRSVFPVICNGKVRASAVWAGDGKVFVNWHVISKLAELNSEEDNIVYVRLGNDVNYRLSLLSEAASDVWLAELETAADDLLLGLEPPVSRDARVGEKVIAVYAVPTGVECSDAVAVVSLDAGVVCTDKFQQARPAVSGAALVSVSDGALLGIYTGSNRNFSLASSVVSRDYDWLDKTTVSETAPGAHIDGKGPVAIFENLKARHLDSDVRRICDAFKPLSALGGAGVVNHVGVQYLHESGAVTIMDPNAWDLVDESGESPDFKAVRGGGVRPLTSFEDKGPRGRKPNVGEFVFSVHNSGKDVVFSEILKIKWISADGLSCRLSGVSLYENKVFLKGSVLVALDDCATLGVVDKPGEASWGKFTEVVLWDSYFNTTALAIAGSSGRDLFSKLATRFSELKTVTWGEDDVRALNVGDQASTNSYSRIGASAVTAVLVAGFPNDAKYVERLVRTSFHDDEWMVQLSNRVFPDGGTEFGKSCAERVNTLMVFLGLVYLREDTVGLRYVLDELGLTRIDGTGSWNGERRPSLRRITSGVD